MRNDRTVRTSLILSRVQVLVLTLILGLALPFPSRARQLDGEDPISLSLAQAKVTDVLRSFASILGGRLDIEPGIEGKVTIELQQVPWGAALDRVCHQQALDCRIVPDPDREGSSTLRVRRARGGVGKVGLVAPPWGDPLLNLSLREAHLGDVLRSFGRILEREVILPEGLDGHVTLEVANTPASLLLEEVCRLNDCGIENLATDGEPLRVVAQRGASPRVNLELVGAGLRETLQGLTALPILGETGEAEVRIDPAFEAAPGGITLSLHQVHWAAAVEAICQQAGCRWRLVYGVPSRLEILPLAMATAAPGVVGRVGGLGSALHLGLRSSDGGEQREATARLRWTQPVAWITAGDWQGRGAWIPFGEGLQVVLPLLLHCRGEGAVHVFPPLTLPLKTPWSETVGTVTLDLASVAPAGASPAPAPGPCPAAQGRPLQVRLGAATLTLPPTPGAYLLLAPPGDATHPDPPPAAALVALGATDGGTRVAWIEPTADRDQVRMERLTVQAGASLERVLAGIDGARIPLAVREAG